MYCRFRRFIADGNKILGQAFISGTLFSYLILFSAAGTIGSALVMYALHKIPRKVLSLAGISMAGAFVSNCIQLLSVVSVSSEKDSLYDTAVSLYRCGNVLDPRYFCETFGAESEWYAHVRDADSPLYVQLPDNTNPAAYPWIRLITGFTLLIALLFIPGLPAKAVIFSPAFTFALRKNKNILDTALYFNGGYYHLPSFIPVGRAFLDWKVLSYKRSIAERFGKSRYSASDDLSFTMDTAGAYPISGTLGVVLDESLYIFKQLLEFKDRIRPRHLITSIDELLLSLPFIINNPEAKHRGIKALHKSDSRKDDTSEHISGNAD